MPLQTLADVLTDFAAWARGLFGDIQDEVTGTIDKTVQAIVDIKEMDCGGKWTVYVKTAFPAAGEALYLLLTPSFEEILESYLHPKTGRRGGRRGRRGERERRTGRNGKPRTFFGGGIPDIDNLIADSIIGRAFFKGRQIGATEYVFWTGIEVADAVLWQWLLLSATETFTTTWHSGLLESGECIREGPAYAKVLGPMGSCINNDPSWYNYSQLLTRVSKNLTIGNLGGVVVTNSSLACKGYALARGTFTFQNTSSSDTAVRQFGFVLFYQHPSLGQQILCEVGQTLTIAPNSTGTIEVSGFGNFPLAINWAMRWRYANLNGLGAGTPQAQANLEIHGEALADV